MAQGYARQDAGTPLLVPVYGDIPVGLVNGSNVIFHTAAAPYGARAAVYWNGQRLLPTDYSISGSTITMAWAPTEGTILCDYFT